MDNLQISSNEIDLRLSSPRMCDNCVIMDKCPYARAGSECYFSKMQKIALKEKNDLLQGLTGVLEMQLERIYHLYNLEKVDGGYPNSDLSDLIQQFFMNVKKMKDIFSDGASFTITATGSGTNILKELFSKKWKL